MIGELRFELSRCATGWEIVPVEIVALTTGPSGTVFRGIPDGPERVGIDSPLARPSYCRTWQEAHALAVERSRDTLVAALSTAAWEADALAQLAGMTEPTGEEEAG